MNILRNKLKSVLLIAVITVSMMLASTQNSKATLYESYLPDYTFWLTYYITYQNNVYYGYAYAYLYYWYGSFYSDYYGYQSDSFGYKSDQKLATAYSFFSSALTAKLKSFTNYTYYYAYYAYYGDYYYHHYVLGDV
jgi:hypothetical protein